jgi:transposase
LEGPVRAVAKRQNEAEQAYEQRHFAIDWERQQVTCPQGRTSVTWRAGLDDVGAPRICAIFSCTDCGACAVRTLCTSAKEARRSIYFHPRPEYEALNKARARMNDPAWKERYHVRAGIEGTLSQGVRVWHAPQPLHRPRKDRVTTGLHGCGIEPRALSIGSPERRAPKRG